MTTTPTPMQSFKKCFFIFIQALVCYFILTQCCLLVLFIVPNDDVVPPSSSLSSLLPKQQKIIKTKIQVEKVRTELTQEQLQRIHDEMSLIEDNESSISTSSTSSTSDNKDVDKRLQSLQSTLSKIESAINITKDYNERIERLVKNMQQDTLFNPVIQSLVTEDGLDIESTKEDVVVSIDAIAAFFNQKSNYYHISKDDLVTNVIEPIKVEFDTMIQRYRNGDIEMKDIIKAFHKLNFIESVGGDNKSCDNEYLKLDPNTIGNRKYNNGDNMAEDNGIYATKDDLNVQVNNVKEDLKQLYNKFGKIDPSSSISVEDILASLLTNKSLSLLKENIALKVKKTMDEAQQQANDKYNQLVETKENIESNINYLMKISSSQSDQGNDDSMCVDKEEVEYIMTAALKYAIHHGMELNDAMERVIDDYNSEYINKDALNSEDLENIPTFLEPKNVNVVNQKEKLQDLLNIPLVPYSIKALDEGIEMITGYNEALDRLIDFISGFSETDDGEDGTVGKSVESGLVYLLSYFNNIHHVHVPFQKDKAGILLK